MLTAVVYTGNTGFTEKYANWVANQLKCDLFRLEDVSIDDLKQYPLVVYGGWVKGGIIQGLEGLGGVGQTKGKPHPQPRSGPVSVLGLKLRNPLGSQASCHAAK